MSFRLRISNPTRAIAHGRAPPPWSVDEFGREAAGPAAPGGPPVEFVGEVCRMLPMVLPNLVHDLIVVDILDISY
jgi:hypothetical protein